MKSSLRIKNVLSELITLQKYTKKLEKKWSLPRKFCSEINLLLDELITNVIEHGDQENIHYIDISLSKTGRNLTIEVIDDGPQFDPTSCNSPDINLPIEKRRCGGLGIFLVRKLSDSCCYKRSQNKNIFTLRKTLPEECR